MSDIITNQLNEIKNEIIDDLLTINTDTKNWAEEFNIWSSSEDNVFDALLIINDPFNLSCAGERQFFSKNNTDYIVDLELIKLSVFFCEKLKQYSNSVFEKVINTNNYIEKELLIKNYYQFTNGLLSKKGINQIISILYKFADKQLVLSGKRNIDIYPQFYTTKCILNKSSIESLYLQFTYWRLTSDEKVLDNLLGNLSYFLQEHYYSYAEDKDLHLDYDISNLSLIQKLNCIMHWLKYISFYNTDIFKEYQNKGWLIPLDTMAEDFIITNQISKYQMLQFKRLCPSDSSSIVKSKAICNQSYGIWIKTADILCIVNEILKLLYNQPNNNDAKSKSILLNLFDNSARIKNDYLNKIFKYRVHYDQNKNHLDSSLSIILEEESKKISELSNTFLNISNAILDDDIDSLLKSKNKYIDLLSDKITNEEKELFNIYMNRVVDKIKSNIQKTNVYDNLYSSISNDFSKYAGNLIHLPQIFCSLVSAEYLYDQYIACNTEISNFDYSCISIMYYIALEDFINKIIYTPYFNSVLINKDQSDWKDVVSNPNLFWDKKNNSYKKTCEIGNLGYLLKAVYHEKDFLNYMNTNFQNVKINKIIDFGKKLIKISSRRNNAAHGGIILSYETVKEDKEIVYNEKTILEHRGLILQLLSILYD